MEEPKHLDLITRCLKGDSKAQYRLFDLYVKAMYNTVLRMMGDAMEAEDIVQEGFVKAFANLDQWRADSSFGAWLKRIMVNTALEQLRKNKLELTELNKVEEFSAEAEETWTNPPPDMKRVNAEIQKLPKGCRLVFTLYLVEGYDQKEVSDILKISLSTVKSQYHRAKKLLRNALSDRNDG